MSALFNVAASKGISYSVNSHKIEKGDKVDSLFVHVEVSDVARKCHIPRYYPIRDYSPVGINALLADAITDAIKLFIGDASVIPSTRGLETEMPKLMPQIPAAPARTAAPARVTEDDDQDDDEQPAVEAPRRGRGRPPKADPAPVAPVEPKVRKDAKPAKEIVKYAMGDKILANSLGAIAAELFGADFKRNDALYQKIKDVRPQLIGIPMLADGVPTQEFKDELRNLCSDVDEDCDF